MTETADVHMVAARKEIDEASWKAMSRERRVEVLEKYREAHLANILGDIYPQFPSIAVGSGDGRLFKVVFDRAMETFDIASDSPRRFHECCQDAVRLLVDINIYLCPDRSFVPVEEGGRGFDICREIWHHRNDTYIFAKGHNAPEYFSLGHDFCVGFVRRYLGGSFRSSLVEWRLLDALVFADVIEFGEKAKRIRPNIWGLADPIDYPYEGDLELMNKARTRALWRFRAFKWLALPAAAISSAWIGWPIMGVGSGGLFAILVVVGLLQLAWQALAAFLDLRRGGGREAALRGLPYAIRLSGEADAEFRQSLEIYESMRKVYRLLAGDVLNPGIIKAEIMSSKERGAIWSNAIYALTEHVVFMNPVIWKIEP